MMKLLLLICLIAIQTILAANIDCALVRCLAPACDEGEELFTPPGQCCPTCKSSGGGNGGNGPDCSTVLCASVACGSNKEIFVPNGQCCPKCRGCGNSCKCGCRDCDGNCQNFEVQCTQAPCNANPCLDTTQVCTDNYCGGCNSCCN
mmetsp:Transcript_37756/g.33358  ORF Transcript_37756/g.33358 Transcript_37756/m.33358 type:complete len:147 (-) Transcript_37756:89-529(-)